MGLTRIRAEQISDIDYKQAVRVVTTTNITLSGGAPNAIDSVNLAANDRVLVVGQSTTSQNGIYLVQTLGTGANGTWVRSFDANQTGEIEAGMVVMVTEGTVYADTQWVLATNNPIVVGTTGLVFQQNITNTGNIAQGTSSIRVLANSNVLINVAGVPNVAVFYNDGQVLTGNLEVSKSVVITGNLTVNGTTTTINSNVITTNDKTFTLANNQSTGAGVDGAGIEVGSPAVATFYYNNATSSWQSNVGITPVGNATVNLGASTNLWATVHANNVSALSDVTASNFSAVGNVTGGNVNTAGLITAGGNVTGGNISTAGALSAGSATIGNILPTANATYNLGSPTSQWKTLYVSGNTIYIGDSSITSNATSISLTNPSGASFAVTGNSVANSVGVFGSVSAIGNIIGGNVSTTGLITAGNITATGTVTGATLNVSSADLAELYSADAEYAPGTVLEFGGVKEVTVSTTVASTRVAGVVSTSPASLMNSLLQADFAVQLALTGRVPTSVVGTVRKGDMMISAGNGSAVACAQPQIGSVIGKALEDFDGSAGVIEIVVGRL